MEEKEKGKEEEEEEDVEEKEEKVEELKKRDEATTNEIFLDLIEILPDSTDMIAGLILVFVIEFNVCE